MNDKIIERAVTTFKMMGVINDFIQSGDDTAHCTISTPLGKIFIEMFAYKGFWSINFTTKRYFHCFRFYDPSEVELKIKEQLRRWDNEI